MPSYRGYVYLIGSSRFGWYKIGQSRTAEIRVQTLGILLPFKIEVFAVWKTEHPVRLEAAMHEKYSEYRINGEWFSFQEYERAKVVSDDPPLHAVKVAGFGATFSNIDKDVLLPKSPKKRLDDMSFMEWVKQYLLDSGLESTPENNAVAQAAVRQIFMDYRKQQRKTGINPIVERLVEHHP